MGVFSITIPVQLCVLSVLELYFYHFAKAIQGGFLNRAVFLSLFLHIFEGFFNLFVCQNQFLTDELWIYI